MYSTQSYRNRTEAEKTKLMKAIEKKTQEDLGTYLRREYVEKGKSASDISSELGIKTQVTIFKFLRFYGLELHRKKWSPKQIDEAFDDLKQELGRNPTSSEFIRRRNGAHQAIVDGRYNTQVTNWRRYLKYRNLNSYRNIYDWSISTIDEAFDEIVRKLGRTPKRKEFRLQYPGSVSFIVGGRYNSDINSWGLYLNYRLVGLNRKIWSHKEVDKAFNKLKKKLKRIPRAKEFSKEYGRAYTFIRDGQYDPNITNWEQYLEHKGVNPIRKKWTPKKIDETFDSMLKDLERVPRAKEFSKEYGRAYLIIIKGKYDQKITRWSEYLAHRGFVPEKFDHFKFFQEFLETHDEAQQIRNLLGDYEELRPYLSPEEEQAALQSVAQRVHENLNGQKGQFPPEKLMYIIPKLNLGVVQRSGSSPSLPEVLSRVYEDQIIGSKTAGRIVSQWLHENLEIDQTRTAKKGHKVVEELEKELVGA